MSTRPALAPFILSNLRGLTYKFGHPKCTNSSKWPRKHVAHARLGSAHGPSCSFLCKLRTSHSKWFDYWHSLLLVAMPGAPSSFFGLIVHSLAVTFLRTNHLRSLEFDFCTEHNAFFLTTLGGALRCPLFSRLPTQYNIETTCVGLSTLSSLACFRWSLSLPRMAVNPPHLHTIYWYNQGLVQAAFNQTPMCLAA